MSIISVISQENNDNESEASIESGLRVLPEPLKRKAGARVMMTANNLPDPYSRFIS